MPKTERKPMNNVPTTSSIPIDAMQAATPPPKSSTSHLVHGERYRGNNNPRNADLNNTVANTDLLDPLRLAPVPVAPQMQMPCDESSVKLRETARHVLWHFGDRVNGQEPGSFVESLMLAIGKADVKNFRLLSLGFPTLCEQMKLAMSELDGLNRLVAIVRDEF